ncbi:MULTISPECIES: short-chain dehydrogenase/reductase [unclassified Nocardioides]|uniref:short-chain dehydrogenase/reductase n=1 Tax=unclassified Nocardioides TaxID=2615069 RepID=UPI0006FDEE0B|nr:MULTISPECIES: short-chain dehydrogenase/reductase [unclassified Nocardioides]KRA32373.1 short-chain dehydrogenase [Nocardioides sp. Root614]KRA89025.1 short-chain dehydrogenase [Nocardioides sp. Root682]
MSTYDVRNKVALVTGAARGIGYETARQLAARGAQVVVVDLDQDAATKAAATIGDSALGLGADVTDSAAMEAVVARTVEQFGRLDIVVANAGIGPRASTVNTMDPAVFERVLEVNVLGVYRTVHAALPEVIRNEGHVVVVASIYAFINGILMAPYAMSKAAVEQFGRALRAELAQHGASATVAYFGYIDTDLVRDLTADPIAHRLEEKFPTFLRRRLQPSQAGATIVAGIEARAPQVIAPKRWSVYSQLRGLINPLLDARITNDDGVQEILRDAEASVRLAAVR